MKRLTIWVIVTLNIGQCQTSSQNWKSFMPWWYKMFKGFIISWQCKVGSRSTRFARLVELNALMLYIALSIHDMGSICLKITTSGHSDLEYGSRTITFVIVYRFYGLLLYMKFHASALLIHVKKMFIRLIFQFGL